MHQFRIVPDEMSICEDQGIAHRLRSHFFLESSLEHAMSVEAFSGKWSFDRRASELKSPPVEWQQTILAEGGRVSVREEIARQSGDSVVEVTGAFDGKFYRVEGSPLVEEIAYTFDGKSIHGTGRKQGAVALREVVSLLDSNTLNLAMTIFLGGKELPLGNAVFRRV
jgi:hypothetical protein